MYCRNCGCKNAVQNHFCVRCGNSMALPKKKDPYLKIALTIIAAVVAVGIFFLVLITLAFQNVITHFSSPKRQEMHSSEELLAVLDNLNCSKSNNGYYGYEVDNASSTKNQLESCNLKDKYEVIKEEIIIEERKIELKLKDYDVKFSITSSKKCTGSFSASCIKTEYVITTDYQEKTTEYFFKQYTNRNKSNVCNDSFDRGVCAIIKEEDVKIAAQYIFNYAQYLNSLDFKFLDKRYTMLIEFPNKKWENGVNYWQSAEIVLQNGKYVVNVEENKEYKIVNEEEFTNFLLNYAHDEGIF